jgi:hypothetical protein
MGVNVDAIKEAHAEGSSATNRKPEGRGIFELGAKRAAPKWNP